MRAKIDELKELIENADFEELFCMLYKNIIHVRDVDRVIDDMRAEALRTCDDICVLDARLSFLQYVQKRVHEEYHDFTINHRTLTLRTDKFLYKSAEVYTIKKRV